MKRRVLAVNEQGCTTNCGENEDVHHVLVKCDFLVEFDMLFPIGLVSIRLSMTTSWSILLSYIACFCSVFRLLLLLLHSASLTSFFRIPCVEVIYSAANTTFLFFPPNLCGDFNPPQISNPLFVFTSRICVGLFFEANEKNVQQMIFKIKIIGNVFVWAFSIANAYISAVNLRWNSHRCKFLLLVQRFLIVKRFFPAALSSLSTHDDR
ncbi:transmembrane protein, putative [Medicago truncatula]|uniref:Transmembrane protein, putative n=1 Tax=Medicago truncatula TaxID=3880 RepID=G7IAE6_MEDTR|nr:transmembrane protein, putative [Medicago truncatula]